MADIFIKTEKLCYSYAESEGEPKMPVLKGIDLEIERGSYVAILGHNGSGKSTLAKLLNMIYQADSGEIFIDGKKITSSDMTDDDVLSLRKKIGMVFQNPDNQLVATIVEEDVAFGPENLGIPSAEIRERVDNALETVGMLSYAKHEPHRLSGGQKQRIAIAGIIAMEPECMIFDESTAMLDPVGRKEVVETMERLHIEKGITLITITHYMDEAVRADRVIVLNDGEIYLDGTPDYVFSNVDKLRRAGLDVPQSTELANLLKLDGISLDGGVNTPLECAKTIFNAINSK